MTEGDTEMTATPQKCCVEMPTASPQNQCMLLYVADEMLQVGFG